MDSIGAEVGQKMRSAIKAKLMELNCYVDDELPDYIMVMVANKRTKSQMNEDLNLFLSTKTSTFVNWLHIVLKKLKEVTVTNPEVYKKATKRKSEELPDVKVKKEKKNKKIKKEGESSKAQDNEKSLTDNLPITANKLAEQRKIILLKENKNDKISDDNFDIPLLSEVNESSEQELEDIEKKIRNVKSRLGLLVESENEEEDQDCLDLKTEKDELFTKQDVEYKEDNNSVRRRIVIENDRQEENLNNNDINVEQEQCDREETHTPERKKEHKRITFDGNTEKSYTPKKASVLERLGKRHNDSRDPLPQRKKISLSEYRKEEERYLGNSRDRDNDNGRKSNERDRDWGNRHSRTSPRRSSISRRDRDTEGSSRRRRGSSRERSDSFRSRREPRKEGILSRLGVMSKVSVPQKPPEEPEEEEVVREVQSLIKVKPRVIPADAPQPNKNLLLKAVAEAQRSIAQTPKVGSNAKPDALFTKNYKEKKNTSGTTRKIPEDEKTKLRNLITQKSNSKPQQRSDDDDNYDSDGEYIPKPVVVKKVTIIEVPKCVPSSKKSDESESENSSGSENDEVKHQFVITLDGIEETKYAAAGVEKKVSVKTRLQGRKVPSPIIFDKLTAAPVKSKPNIPDKLPFVHPPLSVKNKERCKYWPSCRQGDKCEFVHPTTDCESFPHCKFGEKCLYLHPVCKFGSSCTKRDCPYDHSSSPKIAATRAPPIPSVKLGISPLQNCKFFPNCNNITCPFYHPKLCKYGKYCKNQADCSFSHAFVGKSSLSWRSK